MKIDFDEIIRKFQGKANEIYFDRERLKKLLLTAKNKAEGNKELMEIWEELKLLLELIKDWMKGDYKELSKSSVIMVIIGLLYLVNPFDIIPDFLIGGFIDDLGVIAYVIKKTSDELNLYKKWKNTKDDENIIEVNVEFIEDDNMEDIRKQ